MELDTELQDLLDAHRLLEDKMNEVCKEPSAIFLIVMHARDHVNKLIESHIRAGA